MIARLLAFSAAARCAGLVCVLVLLHPGPLLAAFAIGRLGSEPARHASTIEPAAVLRRLSGL